MKKLINQVETVLNEQLQGFVAAHPALRLHRDPVFIARSDAPLAGKVALISGGGSGHEPMHSGFVGDGMLDGAVPGEIFTSPTPDQVVACAQAVDGGKGVLLLVKNYTGDVLNFETAAELLHDMGTEVAFVLTDDDVAVKDSLYTAGRRGVAGTVLLEKLLGAAARRGDDLASLAALGRRLIIGLNSDASCRRLKGETRPVVAQEDRALLLSALACVDDVVIFDEDTPEELLEKLRPDILVKGGDYKAEDVIGREYAERVEIIRFEEGYSTTGLINKIAHLAKAGKL